MRLASRLQIIFLGADWNEKWLVFLQEETESSFAGQLGFDSYFSCISGGFLAPCLILMILHCMREIVYHHVKGVINVSYQSPLLVVPGSWWLRTLLIHISQDGHLQTCWFLWIHIGRNQTRCQNSVVFSLPVEQIASQLQRIQNSAAWLDLKKRKQDHIILVLNELHWLPVKFLCEYRIALLRTITLTVHSSLTFQLCSAHIKLRAPSDPQVKSFWWAPIQFDHSVCLESAACQSAKYSLSVWVQNQAQDFPL